VSEPFISEIKIFSSYYAPRGWALCNGQLLPINQNQALFALLGTTYGGNGQTNFALPNFRGKVPVHVGNGHVLGETAGTPSVTVSIQQMPEHLHMLMASNTQGDSVAPGSNSVLARSTADAYAPPQSLVALRAGSVSNVGGSQPHNNMQPYLVLNFCIALQGIFPSQN